MRASHSFAYVVEPNIRDFLDASQIHSYVGDSFGRWVLSNIVDGLWFWDPDQKASCNKNKVWRVIAGDWVAWLSSTRRRVPFMEEENEWGGEIGDDRVIHFNPQNSQRKKKAAQKERKGLLLEFFT